MAEQKVSDVDLLKAIIECRRRAVPPTARVIAKILGMSPSSIHRRLQWLVEEEAIVSTPDGFALLPHALDFGASRDRMGVALVAWKIGEDGRLTLASAN